MTDSHDTSQKEAVFSVDTTKKDGKREKDAKKAAKAAKAKKAAGPPTKKVTKIKIRKAK
jgi:hypothetical protein